MKRPVMTLILCVVVLLSIPAVLTAQELRNMELNPFVGLAAHTRSNYEIGFPQAITPIPGQFRLNDSLGGGFRFNVNTTGHWGEDFFFSAEPNKARFIRRTTPPQEQNYQIRIYDFGVNMMYYLEDDENQHTRPFLSVGVGGRMYQPTGHAEQVARDPLRGNLPGFSSSTELALNYGIGFKQRLSNTFGFRMDVRGFVSRNPTFGLPRSSPDANAVVFPATGAMNDLEVSAGFIVKFNR